MVHEVEETRDKIFIRMGGGILFSEAPLKLAGGTPIVQKPRQDDSSEQTFYQPSLYQHI